MSSLKVLVLSSIKGGVGKSVSSVNIASILAEDLPDSNVILIDLDPQGNTSQYLGYDASNIEVGSRELFENTFTKLEDVLCDTYRDNFFIVPTEMSLTNVQLSLNMGEIGYKNRNTILKDKVNEYANSTDKDTIIVMDTRPDFDIFTMNALMCADRVLSPIFPCEFSINGFKVVYNNIMTIRERYNPKLRMLGIFKNNWSKTNTLVVKDIEDELKEYSNILLDTVIPSTINVEQSKAERLPLIKSSAKSKPVTKAYQELVDEIINKWQKVVR